MPAIRTRYQDQCGRANTTRTKKMSRECAVNSLSNDSGSSTAPELPTSADADKLDDSRLDSYQEQNAQQTVSEEDTFTTERYEQFARMLPKGKLRILDVGCNTGRGGLRLKQLRPEIELVGLDAVLERLNALPVGVFSDSLHCLSTAIPSPDQSFDAILAGEFLEHLYPIDVDPTLCEFQRILRIGGRLLLTTPNPNYLRSRFRQKTVYGVSHLTQHFPFLLRRRLMMHGFAKVKIRGSGKVSRYLGTHIPLLPLYGSYLITADKV